MTGTSVSTAPLPLTFPAFSRLPHSGSFTRLSSEAHEVFNAPVKQPGEFSGLPSLTKDRESLLAFFDFPAEHWDHLRTSNPIESVFATVRHRTARTKGALSTKPAKLMVFKLVTAAAKPGGD
jgi:Transposase, Mutator family